MCWDENCEIVGGMCSITVFKITQIGLSVSHTLVQLNGFSSFFYLQTKMSTKKKIKKQSFFFFFSVWMSIKLTTYFLHSFSIYEETRKYVVNKYHLHEFVWTKFTLHLIG